MTSSDQKFIRRSESHVNAPSSLCQNEIITLSTTDYVSESESLASTSTDTSQSSAVSQFLAEMPNPSIQNRKKWPNLARICERYQLSDRAAAAVANSVLVDVGLVTEDDKTRIIDRSKLRRA